MAAVVPFWKTGTYISERIVVSCTRQAVFIVTLSFANMSIMEEVGKIRAQRGGGRFVVENNPVGSSQSVWRKKPFSLHKASYES